MASDNWARYNAIDGAVTYQIRDVLAKEIVEFGHTELYNLTMQLIPVLVYQAQRGFRVDLSGLADVRVACEGRIAKYQAELDALCGTPLNVNSTPQMVRYFYGTLGLNPYTNRKTGEVTTDDKALSRIFRKNGKGSKEAKLCQLIRGERKFHSSYATVTVDTDGRVRCSWNPRGTKNSRLSSSQTMYGTGMNLQNLDPRFKPFIIADENMMLIELDKKQAEWVITAFVSGDARMIEVVRTGVDPHAYTGSQICRLPVEIVLREHKVIEHASDPEEIDELRRRHLPMLFDGTYPHCYLPRSMSGRQAGKKSNHGLNYRMGYRRFALENEIEEAEARTICEGYAGKPHSAYLGLEAWWSKTSDQLHVDRTIYNVFGSNRRFLDDLSDPQTINDAIAYNPQSTNAEVVNRGLVKTWNDDVPAMRGVDQLAQVHDSTVFQYPVGDWTGMAIAILRYRDHMTPALTYEGREFTIGTDAKIGLNWGSAIYDKEAGTWSNPRGMREVKMLDDIDAMADQLRGVYESIAR